MREEPSARLLRCGGLCCTFALGAKAGEDWWIFVVAGAHQQMYGISRYIDLESGNFVEGRPPALRDCFSS